MSERTVNKSNKGGRPRGATSYDPVTALAFGQTVRELREKRRIAQEALALDAGVDRGFLGHLERGEKQPSLTVILKLAKALGCTPGKLLNDTAKKLPDDYLSPT